MHTIPLNTKGCFTYTVTKDLTAKSLHSGTSLVLGTPALIAFIEETAWKSIQPFLKPGTETVGTCINIRHESPTPIGLQIYCETTVIEIEGRKIIFTVKATDSYGQIASGMHERFIVDSEKFHQKSNQKLK